MKNKSSAFSVVALLGASAFTSFAFAGDMSAPNGLPSDMPPMNSQAGQCYARVLVPAQYRNVPMEVVTKEASQNYQTREPTFTTRPETIVTKEGYTRYIVTEPTFRNETSTIVTRPAYDRLVATPTHFGARNETVQIREPRMVWRPGKNLSGVRRLDATTGEVYCLVEERGVTQVITRQVVTKPSIVQRVSVPAQTQTITRQIVVKPATVQEVSVPEVSKTIQIQELVTPALERKVMIPEERSTINRQEIIAPEHYEWMQVECDHLENQVSKTPLRGVDNGVSYSVSNLQRNLAQRGLYRGPIDGIYGQLTRDALAKFQSANNLEITGSANEATLKALGF